MTFQNQVLKFIKIYVIGSLIAFGVAVAFWGYQSLVQAFNSKKLVDSQIKYNEALTTQVGRPTQVNYVYPNLNK